MMWTASFQGEEGVISWEKNQEQKLIETVTRTFRSGPFTLSVPGEMFTIQEYFTGSNLSHNVPASYLFLGLFTTSIIFLLAICTTFPRFWFLAGMTAFILIFFSMRLDALSLFGLQGWNIPLTILFFYVIAAYFFHAYSSSSSFLTRVAVFSAITIVVALVIAAGHTIEYPFLHLSITAYTPAIILSVLFLITVAHEIMVAFVYITNNADDNRIRHYSIVSFFYLLYVILSCLHAMNVIDWPFLYVNPFLLLTISAILGIWGFRLREIRYENIMTFAPFGAMYIVMLAIICFSFLGQNFANGNDPVIRIFNDFILFTHTGFGIVFFIYFVSNFMPLMAERLQVYNILFKPTRMPYFSYRLAGLIATLAFVFYSNWMEYLYQGLGGFYNYAADLYVAQGNETYGRAFYDKASSSAFRSHRANYALSQMNFERLNFDGALADLEEANNGKPTAFSITRHAQLLFLNKEYFKAIHLLKKGEKRFPGSAEIASNLCFAYTKIHRVDSALHYFSLAQKDPQAAATAQLNLLAMVTQEYIPVDIDSLLETFNTENPGSVANALAASTVFGQVLRQPYDPTAKRELNLFDATLLNNHLITKLDSADTTQINVARKIASDSLNSDFAEAIKLALAHQYYRVGNVQQSLEILGELAYLSASYKGKYNYLMGLWALEQGNAELAATYFFYAERDDYKEATLYKAIAFSEARNYGAALEAWTAVKADSNANLTEVADQMIKILAIPPGLVDKLSDSEKFQFLSYRTRISDTTVFKRVAATITDETIRAKAIVDMTKRLLEADQLRSAINMYNLVGGLQLKDKGVYDEIRHLELRMLAWQGNIRGLASQINEGITFEEHPIEKTLYTALIQQASNDTTNASRNFAITGKWNPYFEEGVIAAANYFATMDPLGMRSYDMLAEALHVNANSIRLLKAYITEAKRKGFDQFAASAEETLRQELAKL